MAVPTLSDARTFFASDIIISAMPDVRITYWISDIEAKQIVTEDIYDELYFNAFMNLLGHYLYFYEGNYVSINGPISSETTAQVSRSFERYRGDNPMWRELEMTKYGMMFMSLTSRLAFNKGGLVSSGGYYPVGFLI